MFEKGAYIVHETAGVCQVRDISKLDFLKNDRIYYSIVPVYEKNSVLYVPIDNDKVKMRPVMSRQEAEDFIAQLPMVESKQYENDKERIQAYKESLASGDRQEWAVLLRGIFEIWQERKRRGSRLAVRDEECMKRAEKLLYGELAAALGMKPEQVPDYIELRIGQGLS